MPPDTETLLDAAWAVRRRRWVRKLGRLRLGVEPLEIQLARVRRVTWALTAVPGIIGLMFLGLFAAFGRPGMGLILAGLLLGPIIAFSWLDYALLRGKVRAFESELREYEGRRSGRLPG